jgi:hypothetical protein
MDDIESVERQLRSVRRETAPLGLLDRLLADIPETRDVVSRSQLRRWKMPLTAAAAVICISATISVFFSRFSSVESERAVAAEFVIYQPISKETDPCSILPPLPESSRL